MWERWTSLHVDTSILGDSFCFECDKKLSNTSVVIISRLARVVEVYGRASNSGQTQSSH